MLLFHLALNEKEKKTKTTTVYPNHVSLSFIRGGKKHNELYCFSDNCKGNVSQVQQSIRKPKRALKASAKSRYVIRRLSHRHNIFVFKPSIVFKWYNLNSSPGLLSVREDAIFLPGCARLWLIHLGVGRGQVEVHLWEWAGQKRGVTLTH